jgi:hypothetical protein
MQNEERLVENNIYHRLHILRSLKRSNFYLIFKLNQEILQKNKKESAAARGKTFIDDIFSGHRH